MRRARKRELTRCREYRILDCSHVCPLRLGEVITDMLNSFGDIKAAAPQKSLSTRGLKEEPVAIFEFRYRPLGEPCRSAPDCEQTCLDIALLQANGIAPPPPKAARGKKRPLDAGEPAAAGPSKSKRPRPATSDEESSGSDDDDADRVTFLRVRFVASTFLEYYRIADGTPTGTDSYAPRSTREGTGQEVEGR